MYNKDLKCWESRPCEETELIWCREPFNRDNPEALFLLADHMLGQAQKGKETADAVYKMEQAAKMGDSQAALAMGQLFQYGWAVHRSWKKARQWYEQAAGLGCEEAAALLRELEKARRRRTLAAVLCGGVAAVLCLGAVFLASRLSGPKGVLVHEDTRLLTPVTVEEFNRALNDLVTDYDDALVVSGQRSSNRLLLEFEGEGIDLSRFPAATVIADTENYVVIQFDSEEEAQRCLEELRRNPAVCFVDMDGYFTNSGGTAPDRTVTGVPYHSDYTGETYYSWGVEFLGMDRLAAWLAGQQTEPVVVAVLDTGAEPCDETRDRILPGVDMDEPDNGGWVDRDGHGTHVSGTILDCTRGLDVSVLPVQVFTRNKGAPTSYLVQGMKFAMQEGAGVINMSLGGPRSSDDLEENGDALDTQIRRAVERGIVVVVAAGNESSDTHGICPAHNEACIVVSACNEWEDTASFSNYGDSVDVCAPGVEVLSYWPGGTLNALNGTSMAAPHISALAAMLKARLPDRTPAQIEKYITDYCVDMGDEARYGAGIPWAEYLSGD